MNIGRSIKWCSVNNKIERRPLTQLLIHIRNGSGICIHEGNNGISFRKLIILFMLLCILNSFLQPKNNKKSYKISRCLIQFVNICVLYNKRMNWLFFFHITSIADCRCSYTRARALQQCPSSCAALRVGIRCFFLLLNSNGKWINWNIINL